MQRKSNENGDRVIEDSGRFDHDIENSGKFRLWYCKQWECSTQNLISLVFENYCVGNELRIVDSVCCYFLYVLITSERCFMCDLVQTECVVRV
jgi:hypothetical protein